ncbi:MAG: TonB-dependent receptor, partial [Thermodesulfovibrionia bacterium]|nr:TonB-dependent receptor [Thermodesulfovibrionia bacterium]
SFRNPLLDEFFDYFTNTVNTSLTDQSSENYELGVRHYFNEKIYAHANVFIMETEDEIFFNSPVFMNDNLDGETDRKGFELSFSAGLVEWLTVNGTYTYTDASIEGGMFDGKDFPNVPDHKASLETVFYPVEGLMIAINGVYVGERPFISDFTNSFDEQEDYTVINGKVEYKKQNVTIFLDVNNLTDEEYSEYGVIAEFPTEKAFYPSPKRNFLAGLSVEF